MPNNFTLGFDKNVLTITSKGRTVAALNVVTEARTIYDRKTYREAADRLLKAVHTISLREHTISN